MLKCHAYPLGLVAYVDEDIVVTDKPGILIKLENFERTGQLECFAYGGNRDLAEKYGCKKEYLVNFVKIDGIRGKNMVIVSG